VDEIREDVPESAPRILLMTPQGERYCQEKAQELAEERHLIFICGHYRGVDERVVQALVTDEISVGDYILTGGELASAVIIDSVVRLIPGVLGDADSAEADSFSCGMLDHPHYTRPEVFRGMRVPDVLLSGHHANVRSWREEQSERRTRARRPDLLNDKRS
jgi:tRNA (guanine37-N1)-methyltransferase